MNLPMSQFSAAPLHIDPLLGPRHRHGTQGMPNHLEADACVIGSGASGALVADTLLVHGWSVILIEEGALLTRATSQDEVDATTPLAEVRDADGNWVEQGWPWSTRNVGGGTLFYGGASFRYRACDFNASAWLPGQGLDVHWPYSLETLSPYYESIEQRLNVSGGCCDEPVGGRSAALPMSLPAELMETAGLRLGYRPFPTPMAIDGAACRLETGCIDFQCPSGAKKDVIQAYLRPMAANNRFTLISGLKGVAFEQEHRDRIDTLRCLDLTTGEPRRIRARHFFVACNAIQSAGLLLRSTTPFAPQGVGNGYDLVGRGLCMKLSQYVHGFMPFPSDASQHPVGLKGPFSTVSFLDHYLDAQCPSGMGGLIYESRSPTLRTTSSSAMPLELEVIIADTPTYTNRVGLSSRCDRWGLPKMAIDYTVVPHDLARLNYVVTCAERILSAVGVKTIHSKRYRSEYGSTHLHGTCRSGTDPTRSVLDPFCRIHDLENVHVVDGSFMPFPGGLNPTLTIQANALRVARHIVGASPS